MRLKTFAGLLVLLSIAAVSFAQESPKTPARKLIPYDYYIDDLPNDLRLVTIPTDYPNLVAFYIVVATGSRNESRAGQKRLRALLRAHDVSRERELSAREARRNHAACRRCDERLHDRRSHGLSRDVLEGGPAGDHEDGGGPLPAPEIRRAGIQDRGARGARRIQQEHRRADPEAAGDAARDGVQGAHLQAHHDGLHQRHRGHAEPVRLQLGILPAATTGRNTRRSSSSAT